MTRRRGSAGRPGGEAKERSAAIGETTAWNRLSKGDAATTRCKVAGNESERNVRASAIAGFMARDCDAAPGDRDHALTTIGDRTTIRVELESGCYGTPSRHGFDTK
jgi:hypothetical protein